MGKVVIITAASKGIGAACAKSFSENGYKVALMARSEEIHDLAKSLGGVAFCGSVAEESDLSALVTLTMKTYGRIDVLINNTGHPPKAPLLEITDDQWFEGLDLTFMNVVRMARMVTPIMEKQGGGVILNISTFAAFEPSVKFPVSSVFRTALASYTKLYSQQYGKANIRMNNILPGYVESYEIDEKVRSEIPLRRAGKLEEIGETALFLASEGAGYITGENIKVDGGITKNI